MAAHPIATISGLLYRPPRPSVDADMESDMDDEEVDQLDSSTDEEAKGVPPSHKNASASKTRPQNVVERVPGRSAIPASRIDRILEGDGNDGPMSKEAEFLLAMATEEFIKRLAGSGQRQANSSRRNMIHYRDISSLILSSPELRFLHDTVPQPMSLTEALERRATKDKEEPEEDISVAPSALPTPAPSVALSIPPSTKLKGKSRQPPTNDEATSSNSVNGSRHYRERKSRQSVPEILPRENGVVDANSVANTRSRRRSLRAAQYDEESSISTPPVQPNGHHSSPNGSRSNRVSAGYERSSSRTTAPPSTPYDDHPSSDPPSDGAWHSTQYTGPASGYLEDHRLIFNGANGMTMNPGRTIYSHRQQSR